MAEYIEREALIKRICEEKCRTEYGKCQKGKHDDKIILCVCDFINFQPAADVVPVKHAKNLSPDHPVDGFICSACGFEMAEYIEVVTDNEDDPPDKYYREFIPKFCPNCGARMDREGEGHD